MSFFKNRALWILVSTVAVFWLSVVVLGTPFTRDAVDMVAVTIAAALVALLVPHAYDRFRQGGSQGNWKLLMSNALLWAGVVAAALWAYIGRYAGDGRAPDWMLDSPLNGFWRLWTVGAGILALAAIRDEGDRERGVPQSKIYYVLLGVVAGVLIGIAGTRMMMGAYQS